MDESINIEVVDKVARTIKPEIIGIGEASATAAPQVALLSKQLQSFSGLAQFRSMAADTNALASSINKLTSTQISAQLASDKLALSQSKVALAQEKLATQAAKTAEAQSKANIAYLAEESALNKAVQAEQKAISSAADLSKSIDAEAASYKNLTNAQRESITKAAGVASSEPIMAANHTGAGPAAANAATLAAQVKASAQSTEEQLANDAKLKASSDKLLSSIDGKYAAQLKWNKVLTDAKALNAAGVLSEQEFATVQNAVKKGITDVGTAAKGSSTVVRELFSEVREASNGNFTRLAGSLSITAQALGLVSLALTPVGILLIAAAGAAALFTTEFTKGSVEANQFANQLKLQGNYADLTTKSWQDMAVAIGQATDTTTASNTKLIASLASTNNYTTDQIKSLVTASDELSKATGQNASDILASFAKMSEGPGNFAAEFQKQYQGVITPTQVAYIQQLEARGQKEEAIASLIKDITDGIAKNAVDNSNVIYKAWIHAYNGISNYFQGLKQVSAQAAQSPADALAATIKAQQASLTNMPQLIVNGQNVDPAKTKAGLQTIIDQEKARLAVMVQQNAAAQQTTVATKKGQDLLDGIKSDYSGVVDDQQGLNNAVAKYTSNLKAAKALSENALVSPALRKQAADAYTRLSSDQADAMKRLQQQYTPNSVKDDKTADSAAKAAARKAAELAAQQQKAITKTVNDLNGELNDIAGEGVSGAISKRMTDITNSLLTHNVTLKDTAGNYNALGKQILGLITANETQKPIQAIINQLYADGEGAIAKYNDTLAATKQAVDKQYISQEQANVVNNKALETLDNTLDPLRQYNKAISDQNDLLQYYGRNLTIQTKAQQLFNSAVSAGAAKSTDSIQPYVQQAKSQLDAQDMQSAKGNISNNSFEEQNRQLQVQVDAYKQLGITTSEAANNVRDLVTSQKELAVQASKGSWSDVAETSVTKLISGFKNVKSSVLDLSSTFLNDFSNGIANSIGAAIAGTQSLGDSLRQLGQTLISEVIAALIKMGIQWALNATIGRALSAAAVAGTTAEAVATAAAWAPAAALASLATLGTNSAPAAAALATTTALAEGTALLGAVGFATGGYTGNMATSAIAGVVHGQEYVFDAAATNRIGVGNLEAMRNGRLNPAPANDNRGPNITIKPEPGVYVEPQQTPDGHIEMIARRVSSQDFGKNMQSELGNPNTKSSKAMNSAYKVRRNR